MLNWTSAGTDNPGDQVADTRGGHFAVGPEGDSAWSLTLVEQDERDGSQSDTPLGTYPTEQAAKDIAQAWHDTPAGPTPGTNEQGTPGTGQDCDETCALHAPGCDGYCDHGAGGVPHRNACLPDMTAPTGNVNCLEGIRCPRCGAEDSFDIEAVTTVTVFDDGTDGHGDVGWDDLSGITCRDCFHTGTVANFRVRPVPAAGAPAEEPRVTVRISRADLTALAALSAALEAADLGADHLDALDALAALARHAR